MSSKSSQPTIDKHFQLVQGRDLNLNGWRTPHQTILRPKKTECLPGLEGMFLPQTPLVQHRNERKLGPAPPFVYNQTHLTIPRILAYLSMLSPNWAAQSTILVEWLPSRIRAKLHHYGQSSGEASRSGHSAMSKTTLCRAAKMFMRSRSRYARYTEDRWVSTNAGV